MKVLPLLPSSLDEAAALLLAGGVVALPTDTLYGLAADALSEAAVGRVLRIKGRDPSRPLPVLLAAAADAGAVAQDLPAAFHLAAGAFWPGPLTLVVRARPGLPEGVRSAAGGIGLRVPAAPPVRELSLRLGRPLTATSANPSGEPPPRDAEGVRRLFAGRGEAPDLLLDGGPCPAGTPSTVLDLTTPRPRILREGALPRREIERLLGPVG
jgi:L-threonylcarbamoyladenylate synthase